MYVELESHICGIGISWFVAFDNKSSLDGWEVSG